MEDDSRQQSFLVDTADLDERQSLLFDVTNSQAFKAGTFGIFLAAQLHCSCRVKACCYLCALSLA